MQMNLVIKQILKILRAWAMGGTPHQRQQEEFSAWRANLNQRPEPGAENVWSYEADPFGSGLKLCRRKNKLLGSLDGGKYRHIRRRRWIRHRKSRQNQFYSRGVFNKFDGTVSKQGVPTS